MKKMSMKKEVLVIMMMFVMLLVLSSKVLATGGSDGPIGINVTLPTTNTETPVNNEQQTTQPTINQAAPTTNTQVSTYQNTDLPQTGDASDYAIFLLIIVAIIVAGYAYKKVREYNIK